VRFHFRPVVETGATHGAIVHAKAGDADDVKRHVSRGAQRAMLPVLGGISGSTSATEIMKSYNLLTTDY
jgi:hypothetical protein